MRRRSIINGLVPLIVVLAIGVRVGFAADSPAVQVSALTATVGQPFSVSLNLPGQETWATANVGQVFVRQGGRQRTVDVARAAGGKALPVVFDRSGYALVVVDVGPAAGRGRPDAWRRTTRCSKLIVRVDAAGKQAGDRSRRAGDANAGVLGKVGSRIEILPLMDPTALKVGSDLPVRVYYDGNKQAGRRVVAIRPDGSEQTQTTESAGTATFRLDKAGRWTIRFSRTVAGTTYVADLAFEIPSEEAKTPTKQGDAEGGKS